MNKREGMLKYLKGEAGFEGIPAAFFMHFEPEFRTGQPAIDKHLEFFRATGMDFVKIQYEQRPPRFEVEKASDFARLPRVGKDFFEPTLEVVRGLVRAAKEEALVFMTLYSPFMWVHDCVLVDGQDMRGDGLERYFVEDPEAVREGMNAMTQNVITLAYGCMEAGVDGFYASSQGGESGRFKDAGIFESLIKPCDLRVWDAIREGGLNILHVCDYELPYDDLDRFLDYPCEVVNCSLELKGKKLRPSEVSRMFGKPFMGGMERKGALASGGLEEIRAEAMEAIQGAEGPFILAADCTLLKGTPWEHARAAIEAAHTVRG